MTNMRFLMVFTLVAAMFAVGVASRDEGPGLIVNYREGWTFVNTNPTQIKKLNPWEAPRINLRAQWHGEGEEMRIEMDIIYYSKDKPLCPEVEWFNPETDDPTYRSWERLQVEGFRQQQEISNQLTVILNRELIDTWAWMKTTLTLRVCGHVFSPVREEKDNFCQLSELIR